MVSCVIEYPSLDSPGPSRTILSQLGVPACVLGFCLLGFVSIAYTELLPTSLPVSFCSNMALALFCTKYYGASKRSSWHNIFSLAVAKEGCSPTVGVSVLPLLKLRGWTVKMLQVRTKVTACSSPVISCMR